MATRSPFLQLILPLNGEYQDTWDEPSNENWTRIDTWAAGIDQEIVDARFGQASLKEFLEVSHETDGTLKPTSEVLKSRSSLLYGDEDVAGDFDLSRRLNLGDREVLMAREGQPSLRDSIAFRSYVPDQILSGAKNIANQPTWMGFTGPNVQIDGSVTRLYISIGGKVTRTRTLEQVNLTGAVAGVKYIYAQFEADGVIRVDGDSSTPPPVSPSGLTGNDGTKDRKFTDSAVDFTTFDVEATDILEILGTGNNAGEYMIETIAPLGDVNSLIINGVFPGGGLANLDYVIKDLFACTFGFDNTYVPAAGKTYIGEADFDGASVTAVRPMNFRDVYVGPWRAVDVSGGSPTFEETFNHWLMSTELEVEVQVSQANDGTQPIEVLSYGTILNTQAVSINNTLAYVQGTFNPGTSNATHAADSFSGTVTGSLTGSVINDRAIQMKFTKTQAIVKNPTSAKFYRDYTNVQRQIGYIRVIVRKKGY